MRIGLQIPQFRPCTPETMRDWLIDTIQAVDQGGFDSLWVMDHFFQLGSWLGEAETEMIEGYTTLGFFAGLTQKVKIGLLVGGVIYRHPAVVIKMVPLWMCSLVEEHTSGLAQPGTSTRPRA